MNKEEYEKDKRKIFDDADKRVELIRKKYEEYSPTRNLNGWLDGDLCAKEIHEDSKRMMKELKDLENKYNK